jgi:putative ABC transport system substrate-binding protein
MKKHDAIPYFPGPADRADGFLQAASYIDRIPRGTKPVDLPVQTPTKYELVINLTTR